MQIEKIINKIIAPPLAKEGFHKAPSGEANAWVFAKPKENFYHYIYISLDTMPFPSGTMYRVGININSSAPRGYGVSLAKIIENPPQKIKDELMFYDTEEQIEEYLTSAVNVIVDSALPLFDCLDRPVIISPRELHEKLSVNTQQCAEDFMQQHDLSFADDINGVREMILRAEAVIKAKQFFPLEETAEFLVNATAYVGELVRRVHGGEWMWDPNYGRAYLLCNVGGYKSLMSGALGVTFNYWIRPEIYGGSIRSHYKELLHKLGVEDY